MLNSWLNNILLNYGSIKAYNLTAHTFLKHRDFWRSSRSIDQTMPGETSFDAKTDHLNALENSLDVHTTYIHMQIYMYTKHTITTGNDSDKLCQDIFKYVLTVIWVINWLSFEHDCSAAYHYFTVIWWQLCILWWAFFLKYYGRPWITIHITQSVAYTSESITGDIVQFE